MLGFQRLVRFFSFPVDARADRSYSLIMTNTNTARRRRQTEQTTVAIPRETLSEVAAAWREQMRLAAGAHS